MDNAQPRVEQSREVRQVLWVARKQLDQRPVEADQDGHLHHHGPQAADGVNALLLIELEGLLGDALPVLGVLLLDLLDLGLQRGHGPGRAELPHRKREGGQPGQSGEDQDAEADVVEQQNVQEHQAVDHGPDDRLIPNGPDELHALLFP